MIRNSKWEDYFKSMGVERRLSKFVLCDANQGAQQNMFDIDVEPIFKKLGLSGNKYDMAHNAEIEKFFKEVRHDKDLYSDIKSCLIKKYTELSFAILCFLLTFLAFFILSKSNSVFMECFMSACAISLPFLGLFLLCLSNIIPNLEDYTEDSKKEIKETIELRVEISRYLNRLQKCIDKVENTLLKEELIKIYNIVDYLYDIDALWEDMDDFECSYFVEFIELLESDELNNINSIASFVLYSMLNNIFSHSAESISCIFESYDSELSEKCEYCVDDFMKLCMLDISKIQEKIEYFNKVVEAYNEDTVEKNMKEFSREFDRLF